MRRARDAGRPVDLRILRDLVQPECPEEEQLLAEIYRQIKAGPRGSHSYGGSMLTYPNRYAELDDMLVSLLPDRFPASGPLRVHDMAASNAVTSVELFARLQHFRGLRFTASDFYDALRVVTPAGSDYSGIIDRSGTCLQVVGNDRVFVAPRRLKWSEAADIVQSFIVRRFVAWKIGLSGGSSEETEIGLWHPRAIALADTDERFVLRHEDIFAPHPGPYEIVRVLGTLARFGEHVVPDVLASLVNLAAEGGLLVLGDSGTLRDDRLSATIFERRGGLVHPLRDWNGGFSLKSEVTGLRPRAA